MKLHLESDFTDYYDSAFDRSGQIFNRLRRNRFFNHVEGLYLLRWSFSLNTPEFNPFVHRLQRRCSAPFILLSSPPENPFDLYGGRKYLWSGSESNLPPYYTFAAQYIEAADPGVMYRLVQIGNHRFSLKYKGLTSGLWNPHILSQVFSVAWADVELPSPDPLPYFAPLVAIDYVRSKDDGSMYAVNMTLTPILAGTPIEDALSPDEVVATLSKAVHGRLISAATPAITAAHIDPPTGNVIPEAFTDYAQRRLIAGHETLLEEAPHGSS